MSAKVLNRWTFEALPTIVEQDLKPGDVIVGYHNDDHLDRTYRVEWWTIIYRPKTAKVFRIRCWDSASSCYGPDLPEGKLPEDTVVLYPSEKSDGNET